MIEILIISILFLIIVFLIFIIMKITNNHYDEIYEEQLKQDQLKNYLDDLIYVLDTIKKSSILYEDELIKNLHKKCLLTQKFLEEEYYKIEEVKEDLNV